MRTISKKTMILGLVVTAMSIGFVAMLHAEPVPKETICHNGDFGPETIDISGNAVQKHIDKHGDTVGPCSIPCADRNESCIENDDCCDGLSCFSGLCDD